MNFFEKSGDCVKNTLWIFTLACVAGELLFGWLAVFFLVSLLVISPIFETSTQSIFGSPICKHWHSSRVSDHMELYPLIPLTFLRKS